MLAIHTPMDKNWITGVRSLQTWNSGNYFHTNDISEF